MPRLWLRRFWRLGLITAYDLEGEKQHPIVVRPAQHAKPRDAIAWQCRAEYPDSVGSTDLQILDVRASAKPKACKAVAVRVLMGSTGMVEGEAAAVAQVGQAVIGPVVCYGLADVGGAILV